MRHPAIYSADTLSAFIQEVGFLPLLPGKIGGFSADEVVAPECQYHDLPEGGWEWPLWQWKGQIVADGTVCYGKFFDKKAGFVSRAWWADFCNYRRSIMPRPEADSIEDTILTTLELSGSLVTRDLRKACGLDGKGMRSRFDAYITRLQMATYIVTEDFVYARDRHNREYGWGLSLLNTPERLYGRDACQCPRSPEESHALIMQQIDKITR